MFYDLSPIEINCDAPPYSIVEACRMIGLETPEDVRWCRLRNLQNSRLARLDLFHIQTWKTLLGRSTTPDQPRCFCRGELPLVEKYTFTLASGRQLNYLVGQCSRCRTVFWEEA